MNMNYPEKAKKKKEKRKKKESAMKYKKIL